MLNTIAVVGSHSALDVCRGAKDEGFKTLVIVEEGRDKTYANYFKTNGKVGCVDEVLYVKNFKQLLEGETQKILQKKNAIFIPHRSFEVYVNDYDAIENDFNVPIFGNKKLLRIEERNEHPNQYDLLEKAKIKYPKLYENYQQIDKLVMVKVSEAQRKFERAFFLCDSPLSFKVQSDELIKDGKITRISLETAVIEEFILGVQVNFNFFYSPIEKRLELVGTDTRRQTNLEGWSRLPEKYQEMINGKLEIKYEEAGHIAVGQACCHRN
ncbi:DUF1246 domain-containing protein [Candidatus Curtissbacteria bacterium]|nr:DUF1246 domain-containing protein [Candidatus Curtissbacteria bacterium]